MRRAFVGFSGPFGYDYKNLISKKGKADQLIPNPVLDSPFGLMLLYDEIIFLDESLCPFNMRELPFVKILNLRGPKFGNLNECLFEVPNEDYALNEINKEQFSTFRKLLSESGAGKFGNLDYHSQDIQIRSSRISARPSFGNYVLDQEIASVLFGGEVDVISNSVLQVKFEEGLKQVSESTLTQLLIIENIPNYNFSLGPYHPVIDEVRLSPYLRDFRGWISNKNISCKPKDILEVKKGVEATLMEAQEKLFLENLDSSNAFFSIAKGFAGDVASLLNPVVGTIAAGTTALIEWKKNKSIRWQGFIVDARRIARKTNRINRET